ncbi:hypothetical protein [Streptomyces coffeae]|uniref:Uncharacterized protein n=1 Tax=Streptomyces coffeae TaxID=621382 RepID=A0ABS1N9T3_9ACTN|nr:hypothetical protein [Streptomyces coffeae]MBL1096655.1 hypothetical protein [Streptomyces coffeae]
MQRLASWERSFRVWHYTVSYSQLLLRSVNIEGEESRIDILFSNVERMDIICDFETLAIEKISASEARSDFGLDIPRSATSHVFLLNHGDAYVQGTHCEWHEDLGGPRSPSKFGPLRGVE